MNHKTKMYMVDEDDFPPSPPKRKKEKQRPEPKRQNTCPTLDNIGLHVIKDNQCVNCGQ